MSQQQAELYGELEERYYRLLDQAVKSENFSDDDVRFLAWAFGIKLPKGFDDEQV